MGCYIWYSEKGPGLAVAPPCLLLTVPNVTAHPSTASVLTSYYSMWHYLSVPIKGLSELDTQLQLIMVGLLEMLVVQQCFQTPHLHSQWHRWSMLTVVRLVAILGLAWQVLRPVSQQPNKLKVSILGLVCIVISDGQIPNWISHAKSQISKPWILNL